MSQNNKQERKVTHYSIVRSATALLDYAKKYKITYEKLDDKTRAQWNELLGLLEEIEGERQKAERNLAREAKAIVALAFRNGPIEAVHAGKICPTCAGDPQYSHITDEEMRRIVKTAVNRVYEMLCERETAPEKYEATLRFGDLYTAGWDEPEPKVFPDPHQTSKTA